MGIPARVAAPLYYNHPVCSSIDQHNSIQSTIHPYTSMCMTCTARVLQDPIFPKVEKLAILKDLLAVLECHPVDMMIPIIQVLVDTIHRKYPCNTMVLLSCIRLCTCLTSSEELTRVLETSPECVADTAMLQCIGIVLQETRPNPQLVSLILGCYPHITTLDQIEQYCVLISILDTPLDDDIIALLVNALCWPNISKDTSVSILVLLSSHPYTLYNLPVYMLLVSEDISILSYTLALLDPSHSQYLPWVFDIAVQDFPMDIVTQALEVLTMIAGLEQATIDWDCYTSLLIIQLGVWQRQPAIAGLNILALVLSRHCIRVVSWDTLVHSINTMLLSFPMDYEVLTLISNVMSLALEHCNAPPPGIVDCLIEYIDTVASVLLQHTHLQLLESILRVTLLILRMGGAVPQLLYSCERTLIPLGLESGTSIDTLLLLVMDHANEEQLPLLLHKYIHTGVLDVMGEDVLVHVYNRIAPLGIETWAGLVSMPIKQVCGSLSTTKPAYPLLVLLTVYLQSPQTCDYELVLQSIDSMAPPDDTESLLQLITLLGELSKVYHCPSSTRGILLHWWRHAHLLDLDSKVHCPGVWHVLWHTANLSDLHGAVLVLILQSHATASSYISLFQQVPQSMAALAECPVYDSPSLETHIGLIHECILRGHADSFSVSSVAVGGIARVLDHMPSSVLEKALSILTAIVTVEDIDMVLQAVLRKLDRNPTPALCSAVECLAVKHELNYDSQVVLRNTCSGLVDRVRDSSLYAPVLGITLTLEAVDIHIKPLQPCAIEFLLSKHDGRIVDYFHAKSETLKLYSKGVLECIQLLVLGNACTPSTIPILLRLEPPCIYQDWWHVFVFQSLSNRDSLSKHQFNYITIALCSGGLAFRDFDKEVMGAVLLRVSKYLQSSIICVCELHRLWTALDFLVSMGHPCPRVLLPSVVDSHRIGACGTPLVPGIHSTHCDQTFKLMLYSELDTYYPFLSTTKIRIRLTADGDRGYHIKSH